MNVPSLAKLRKLASFLRIRHQSNGELLPFVLTQNQERVISSILAKHQVVVAKARQTFITTAVAYLVMVLMIMNPAFSAVVVADDDKNASKVLRDMRSWFKQLGVPLATDNVQSLELGNGSRIETTTARADGENGQSRAGRGRSYHFIHVTEQSNHRNDVAVWASVTSAKLGGGFVVSESTGGAGQSKFRDLYEGDNGYEKIFLGFESHSYKADPSSVDDITWTKLQNDFGFKDRAAGAWWWAKLHELSGDVAHTMREYPVLVAHCWAFFEGQHIQKWTEAKGVTVDGYWNRYTGLEPEPLILAVDPAAGGGGDNSALALLGHKTGKVHATYARNDIDLPSFATFINTVIVDHKPVVVSVRGTA